MSERTQRDQVERPSEVERIQPAVDPAFEATLEPVAAFRDTGHPRAERIQQAYRREFYANAARELERPTRSDWSSLLGRAANKGKQACLRQGISSVQVESIGFALHDFIERKRSEADERVKEIDNQEKPS